MKPGRALTLSKHTWQQANASYLTLNSRFLFKEVGLDSQVKDASARRKQI